jgi:hypothetical protein
MAFVRSSSCMILSAPERLYSVQEAALVKNNKTVL